MHETHSGSHVENVFERPSTQDDSAGHTGVCLDGIGPLQRRSATGEPCSAGGTDQPVGGQYHNFDNCCAPDRSPGDRA